MDITIENTTSRRTAYVYSSDNCTGDAVGAVAPGAQDTIYGTSVEFKGPRGGGSFEL
ncbi:hypothetical protein ACFYO1_29485 [Nocardia sp. NPDC006044]|uniref:hypothetical protein n=1 Tax=Nocardia sp. NPDC006044 TaxID=3364306 RepID=UPI0036B1DA66